MKGRYGSSPQIDLDKQIARTRVAQPMQLDFQLIARRVRENNMGVGGIHVESDVTFDDGRVALRSGQSFPLEGAATAPGWVRLRVVDYDDPSKTRLAVAPAATPAPQPAPDGTP